MKISRTLSKYKYWLLLDDEELCSLLYHSSDLDSHVKKTDELFEIIFSTNGAKKHNWTKEEKALFVAKSVSQLQSIDAQIDIEAYESVNAINGRAIEYPLFLTQAEYENSTLFNNSLPWLGLYQTFLTRIDLYEQINLVLSSIPYRNQITFCYKNLCSDINQFQGRAKCLGAELKFFRKRLHLTQSELALFLKIDDPELINKWEQASLITPISVLNQVTEQYDKIRNEMISKAFNLEPPFVDDSQHFNRLRKHLWSLIHDYKQQSK